MPLNYDRLLSEIRDDLDTPDERSPADDTILRAIGDVSQLLDLQAQNTGEGWSVAFFDLIVNANQPLYPFNEAQYGKPVRVYTIDTGDRAHFSRKIELVERQNIENYFNGRQVATAAEKHSAVCMVPYWSNGQASIEVIPTPSQSATYRIWYETGEIAEPTKGGTIPVQSPFHRYVRIKAASKLLGKCFWSKLLGSEPDKINPVDRIKLQQMHAERIRPDLVALEIEYAREYREYIANMIQSGTGEAVPYGGWTEEW